MTTTTTDAAITRDLHLPASPERVWAALTEPAQISGWFGHVDEFRLEPGSVGWFDFGGGGRVQFRLEAIDAGHYIAWRWADALNTELDDAGSTLVEWWIEPAGGNGSTLRLRESGFRAEASLDDNTQGWLEELGDLRDHLAVEPWEHPIRRTVELKADRDRVWRALTDPAELAAWWGTTIGLRMEAGSEGWFDFPEHGGRHAVRVEALDAPRYLAFRWTADEPDTRLADVRQPLLVEWVLTSREDGGTNLHLLESGFTGPKKYADNSEGWTEVLADLVKLVDGSAAPATA